MIKYVQAISEGDRHKPAPRGLYMEFNEFAATFELMLSRQEQYYHDLYQQQILLKNAQIKSLQRQMDPHFLFNVLNTAAWQAEINGDEEVYRMLLAIGEMLRANILFKDKDFVPLRTELEYTNKYIYLQNIRFEGRFSIKQNIDPDLMERLIPRFSIQPLIENAVQHGLEPLSVNGELRVNVKAVTNGISVSVEDNGVGFPSGFTLDSSAPADQSHTHVALVNLDQRLRLIYGELSHLEIGRAGGFTYVKFILPKPSDTRLKTN
jgi:sensor histidine kinase YesM